MLASLLAALLLLGPLPTAPADTAVTNREPQIGIRPYPAALWSPMAGFGFGVGVSVEHLGWTGSALLASAHVSERRGVYRAAFATADPFTATAYGIVDARYAVNGRYWFHGVGPASASNDRVAAGVDAASVRLRVGYRPRGGPIVIQPSIGLSYYGLDDIRARNAGALTRLSNRSRTALFGNAFIAGTADVTGLVAGLDVALDTRDRAHFSTRGLLLQLAGKRYTSTSDLTLRFNRFSAEAYGFVPLALHHTLTARARLTVNDLREGIMPFYLLPRLGAREVPGFDRHRFFGNDRLVLSLGYRFPLFRYRDVVLVSGEVAGHAANVYDDVFDQLRFAVGAREQFDADRATYPLQAAGSVGLYVAPLFRDDVFLETAVGLGADGVSAIQFKMVQSFRALRAAFL